MQGLTAKRWKRKEGKVEGRKEAKEEGPVSLWKDESAVCPWPALGH